MTAEQFEAEGRVPNPDSDVARGTWDGGGLHGKYVAGTGLNTTIVLFGSDDRQAVGIYLAYEPTRTEELIALFTREIKPA